MPGLPGSAADPAPSLASLLARDGSLEASVQAALASLPTLDPEPRTAPSMADAVAMVHARDDARKKVSSGPALSKAKRAARTSSLPVAEDRFPGARRGGGDPAAFWLYVEDYFRDVTAHDLAALLTAACPRLDTDPHLLVPPLGPPPTRGPQPLPPAAAPAAEPAPTPASKSALGADAAAAPPTASAEPGSPESSSLLERRSVRLVSRFQRGSGAEEGPATPVVRQPGPGLGGAPPASAAPPGAGLTPLPGTGLRVLAGTPLPAVQGEAPAPGCLLESLSDGDVARLIRGMAMYPTLALPGPEVEEGVLGSLEAEPPAGLEGAEDGAAGAEATDSAATAPDPGATARRTAIEWLRRQAPGVAEGSGALASVPWPFGGPADAPGAGAPQAAESSGEAGKPTADPATPPASSLLPSGATRHPYTRLLLQAPTPAHVQASAHTVPAPDGAGGGAPQAAAPLSGSAKPEAEEGPASGTSTPSMRPSSPGPGDGGRARGAAAAGKRQGMRAGGLARDAAAGAPSAAAALAAGGVSTASQPASRPGSALGTAAAAAPQQTPAAAAAVAACVARGALTVDPWSQAAAAEVLLAAAPQDELLAELLALQSELLVQRVSNARRAAAAVRGALAGLESAASARAAAAAEEERVRAALAKAREERNAASRQRRERAHREAMAQKAAVLLSSPRPTLGRRRAGASQDATPDAKAQQDREAAGGKEEETGPLLGPNEMYDVLAQRSGEEEAYCAVCGDGHSEAPNEIVFCERCDVAVHQRCYDVAELPAGEWLCEPCREYEAEQRAAGADPALIRPPRWASSGGDQGGAGDAGGGARRLPGGARDVACALCPLRCGAFRRAAGGAGRWVHSVCALWTPETYLTQEGVVAGLEGVRLDRATCAICGQASGSVVTCNASGCAYAFHPLCARNLGLYLAARVDGQGRPQYRIYCAVHSAREQEKDQRAWAARLESAAAAAAEEARRGAALAALAAREEQRRGLGLLRYNLEQARMLVDLTKKRERLKKQLAGLARAEHAARLRDPAAALARLHAAQSAAVQALLMAGARPAGAQAPGTMAARPTGTAQGPVPAAATLPPGAPPPGADAGAAWAALHAQQAQVLARLSALSPGALLRLGGMAGGAAPGVGGPGLRPPFPMLPPGAVGLSPAGGGAAPPAGAAPGFLPGPAGGAGAPPLGVPQAVQGAAEGAARRGAGAARRGKAAAAGGRAVAASAAQTAPLGVPPSLAAIATPGNAAAGNAGAAAALRIDRERVMTPREAAAANSRLPPKFKYVPLEELHGRAGAEAGGQGAGQGLDGGGEASDPGAGGEGPGNSPAALVPGAGEDAAPESVVLAGEAPPGAQATPPPPAKESEEPGTSPALDAALTRANSRPSPKVDSAAAPAGATRSSPARVGSVVAGPRAGASRASMRGVRGGGVTKAAPAARRRR
ncbi:hypothetical protein ACKKBG_A36210 [Auxenochlorella protothecoides x Auxenochlorella symbiontica]